MEGDTCPAASSPKPPASPLKLVEEKVNMPAEVERVSPESSCPICRRKIKNKSYPDGCLHQFCFFCLAEWSKVKAECPLCKLGFRAILQYVRSDEAYDEYQQWSSDAVRFGDVDNANVHRFHYSFTLAVERRRERTLQNWRRPFIKGTDEIGPHRARIQHHRRKTLTCSDFRVSVYEQNLWVRPFADMGGRYRECSPEFYRSHPAQFQRLVPWLNREFAALLPNNSAHRVVLLDMFYELVVEYPIRSSSFHSRIIPFLRGHASHFQHEFYEFARSPFNMIDYDQAAHYIHI